MYTCTHIALYIVPLADPVDANDTVSGCLGSHQFQGTTITVTRGDYSPLMKRMADNLEKAKVNSHMYLGTVD